MSFVCAGLNNVICTLFSVLKPALNAAPVLANGQGLPRHAGTREPFLQKPIYSVIALE